MRLFPRSQTYRRPPESIAMQCGPLSCPGPEPFVPHVLMNVPSPVNLTTRVLPPSPSETKMLPLGAITTSLTPLKVSCELLSPATSFLPIDSSSLPSGVNLKSCCDFLSVSQTNPSSRTRSECGYGNCPSPQLLTNLPLASKTSTFDVGSSR